MFILILSASVLICPSSGLSCHSADVAGKLMLPTHCSKLGTILWSVSMAVPAATFSSNSFLWIQTGGSPSFSRGIMPYAIEHLTLQLPWPLRILIILLSFATLPIFWRQATSNLAMEKVPKSKIWYRQFVAITSRRINIWYPTNLEALSLESEWVRFLFPLRQVESIHLEEDPSCWV